MKVVVNWNAVGGGTKNSHAILSDQEGMPYNES